MKLNATTKIDDVLKEYPFLVDFLPTLSPRYKKLKNLVVRSTIGKVTTLEMVAKMGRIDLVMLISEIKKLEGERRLLGWS